MRVFRKTGEPGSAVLIVGISVCARYAQREETQSLPTVTGLAGLNAGGTAGSHKRTDSRPGMQLLCSGAFFA